MEELSCDDSYHYILGRTFQISCGTSTGTCFTIDVEDRQYIVTARHVVESVTDHIKILRDETWKNLSIKLVGHGEGDIDISVLATDLQLSPAYPWPTTMDRIGLAQDVYFLGFPYGLANDAGHLNRNFHAALVKKGILSAIWTDNGIRKLLLDGHNNPGFSGGPVVFQPLENQYKKLELVVAGVVSGYRFEQSPVYMGDTQTPFGYRENTGIIIAYDIAYAVDLIRQNPIGFELITSEA